MCHEFLVIRREVPVNDINIEGIIIDLVENQAGFRRKREVFDFHLHQRRFAACSCY
jgi:hypothetical protein